MRDPDSDNITQGTVDMDRLFCTASGAQYVHDNAVWPKVLQHIREINCLEIIPQFHTILKKLNRGISV